MKMNVGGLCLRTMLAISMLAVSLYADQSAAFKRTLSVSAYDLKKEITLQGTVQSLVRKPEAGAIPGAHLIVSTAQGEIDAHIGNYLVVGRYATAFDTGQSVKLVGMMTEVNHHSVFLVRTLQMGDRTLTVRSDHGFLVYPGSRARLSGVSTTGGAR